MVFDGFRRFLAVFNDFRLCSTALNGFCGLHDYPTLPKPRCGRVASPGVHKVVIFYFYFYFYYYYFIIPPRPWCLCLVQTGMFACKPCLKYSRIHGTKVQSHIECVKGRCFSTVLVAYMRSIHRDVVCEPNWWATWLACSLNMWLTHCSLGLVQKLVCLLVNHA